MKLEKLTIKDLLRIESAEIDFSAAPVHLVLGENEQGKSSIRDAMLFALVGKCRGMKNKKDGVKLARDGAKKSFVELNVNDLAVKRTAAGKCSLTEKMIRERIADPAMIDATFDAFRFLGLDLNRRRDLVATVSSDTSAMREAIDRLCFESGLDKSTAELIAAEATTNLDRTCKLVSDEWRPELHRKLKALPQDAPSGFIEDGANRFVLKDLSSEMIANKKASVISDLNAAREKKGGAKLLGSPEILEKELAETAAKLENLAPQDDKVLDLLKDRAVKATSESMAAASEHMRLSGAWSAAESELARIKGLTDSCVTCGQDIAENLRKKMIKNATDRLNGARTAKVEAKSAVDKAELAKAKAVSESEGAVEANKEWHNLGLERATISARLEESRSYGGADEEIEKHESRLVLANKLVEQKRLLSEWAKVGKERIELESKYEAMDKVAKGLGKNGDIRKLASKGFDLAIVQDAADKLLGGRQVTVNSDWEMLLDGKDEWLLSRSAKFCLGAGMAAALAKASGLGVLVLDEVDVLMGGRRKAFLGWLQSIAPQFENIIVFASSDKAPASTDWLAVHWIEDGKLA